MGVCLGDIMTQIDDEYQAITGDIGYPPGWWDSNIVLPFKPRVSYDFAVRQATLSAMHEWMPITIRNHGLAYTGQWITARIAEGILPDSFRRRVIKNFREIAKKYDLVD